LIQKSSDAASDSLMSDTTGARPRGFRDAVLWNERRSSAAKADGAISFCATVCRRNVTMPGRKPKTQVKAKNADD
jgi:hypothetical protein